MSSLRQLKVMFDSFDDLVEGIAPGLSRTHLFAPTDEVIVAGTRVRLEIGTARKGATIRGVAKVAGPGEGGAEQGLHLHIIHLDPSSTRLVDSIVRGEIAGAGVREPSGPSPFDIPPTDLDPAPEPEEVSVPEAGDAHPEAVVERSPPADRSRLGRYAWALALMALAGAFLLVFEFASRSGEDPLLTGRDRSTPGDPAAGDPATDSGEPAELPAPTDPVHDTPPAVSVPPAATGEPAAGPVDSEAAAEQVEEVVLAWAAAWSRQDPGAYLELYAPDYSPPGLDRDAWQRRRRSLIRAPESVEVLLSEVEVEIVGPGRARARFHQFYAAGDKRLAARKLLELERLTAGWKIVAERVEQ